MEMLHRVLWLLICLYDLSNADNILIGKYGINVPSYNNIILTRPDGKGITLTVIDIQEVDQHGNAITTSGHRLSMDTVMANVTVGTPCETLVPSSNVESRYVDVKSLLDSGVQSIGLGFGIYVITKDGALIRDDSELQRVKPNDIRLTLRVSGWKFCTPCKGEDGQSATGNYLDVKVQMQLPANSEAKRIDVMNGPNEVILGNKMTLYLPKQVRKDGAWEKLLPTNYPEIQSVGSRSDAYVIIFRLPKFSHDVKYDPVFSLDEEDDTFAGDDYDVGHCSSEQSETGRPTNRAEYSRRLPSFYVVAMLLIASQHF